MERSSVDEPVAILAAEIDGTLIEERLRLTPTERLESMFRVLEFTDEARKGRGNRRQGGLPPE
jgi:hypothetical protein